MLASYVWVGKLFCAFSAFNNTKKITENNRTGPKKKAELGKLVNAPGHKSGI